MDKMESVGKKEFEDGLSPGCKKNIVDKQIIEDEDMEKMESVGKSSQLNKKSEDVLPHGDKIKIVDIKRIIEGEDMDKMESAGKSSQLNKELEDVLSPVWKENMADNRIIIIIEDEDMDKTESVGKSSQLNEECEDISPPGCKKNVDKQIIEGEDMDEMESVEKSLQLNKEFGDVLPRGWKTNIIDKQIIEGEDKFPNVELRFFINCTNREDFRKWLTEFENLTYASYIIKSTDNAEGARVKFKQRLRCHHFTRCPKLYDPAIKNKTRNTKCPSKLTVTIHVPRKKYRGKQEKFKLLQETPCEIILVLTHNHITGTADSLRFRKVSDTVKEELLSLYQNGHTARTALEMIKSRIQLTTDDYVTALADRNTCPSYKYCYDLYIKEFKKKCGPMEFDTEAKCYLENKLALYNEQQKDECAKMVTIREGNVDCCVIGICTPLMKRVHKNIEAASEIVFMDSSGTVDKDGCRIFVLLTDSECGALPLGLIITTSESIYAIKSGFQILKELLNKTIFGGHKEGPKVFMTDDSTSEQMAIGDTWTQSKIMLSNFHVLQAVSRWLSKSKKNISRHQQNQIYNDFRNILYANSIVEMTVNYNLALENAKPFPTYMNYLSNYWWPKRESWVKAYRNGLLMKNNNTSNYSETTIRQIRVNIFSHIKAFDLVQMADFMLTKFDEYTQRDILDATSNHARKNPLFNEIMMPSLELIQRITKLSDSIVAIPSETKTSLMYLVNMEVLTCSCIVGVTGAICKHIHWANMLYCTEMYVAKIDNIKIKENLNFVATGQTNKTNSKAESSTALNKAFIPTSSPTDSDNGGDDVHSTSSDNEEIENKFHESMAKISEIFYENFKKSPLEVSSSVEKMMTTLEKIRTPAAFSSAVATFGLGAGHSRKVIHCKKEIHSKKGIPVQNVRLVGVLKNIKYPLPVLKKKNPLPTQKKKQKK